MMKSSARLLRTALQSASISSELNAAGFVGAGPTRVRRKNGIRQVVDFQPSRYSDPGTVSFTINVGLLVEKVWQIYFGVPAGAKTDEAYCFPRFRVGEIIGDFAGQSRDVWWEVSEGRSADPIMQQVKVILFGRVLPLLDRLDSIAAIFRFIETEAPLRYPAPYTRIVWAIVSHLHGAVEKATRMLDELESDPRLGSEWRDQIHAVRSRLAFSHAAAPPRRTRGGDDLEWS